MNNILDKWVMARLNQLIGEVSQAVEEYELDRAVRPIGDFVDDLSNWYLRRSRERFRSSEKEKVEKILREVLITFSKLIAPFIPFVAENIYQELNGEKGSVHLEDWPGAEKKLIDEKLLEQMKKVREDVSLGLDLRLKAGIKVRQPLSVFETPNKFDDELAELIKGELNVREVRVGKEYKLATELTPELIQEGQLRELTRAVQELRKQKGLMPSDQIELVIATDAVGEKFIKKFEGELKKPTNTKIIKLVENDGEEIKIGELSFKIGI